MMGNVPVWFTIVFWSLFIFALIFGLLLLTTWLNASSTKGKMLAEIWEPSGYAVRKLTKLDSTGSTVTVDNLVYRLPKEKSEKELAKKRKGNKELEDNDNTEKVHTYPRRRWVMYPANPPLGMSFLQIPVRIESWERDNPEPIRPFYGRISKDGKFEDSQLTVTSTEWQAQKSVIQATGIAMSVQEREAREKEWQRAMANQPNKMIVYLGLLAAVACSAISLVLIYQFTSAGG